MNVEVRKKRTYVKRSVEEAQLEAERKEAEQRAQEEKERLEREALEKAKQLELEKSGDKAAKDDRCRGQRFCIESAFQPEEGRCRRPSP